MGESLGEEDEVELLDLALEGLEAAAHLGERGAVDPQVRIEKEHACTSKKTLIRTIFFLDNNSYLEESILWRDI